MIKYATLYIYPHGSKVEVIGWEAVTEISSRKELYRVELADRREYDTVVARLKRTVWHDEERRDKLFQHFEKKALDI